MTFYVSFLIVTILMLAALVYLVTKLVNQLLAQTSYMNDTLIQILAMNQVQLQESHQREQSLMNQLRSTDPMTLLNLQAATQSGPLNQFSNSDEEYVSHSDEAEAELLAKSGSFVPVGEVLDDANGIGSY